MKRNIFVITTVTVKLSQGIDTRVCNTNNASTVTNNITNKILHKPSHDSCKCQRLYCIFSDEIQPNNSVYFSMCTDESYTLVVDAAQSVHSLIWALS